MRIISKIEINYFRSTYVVNLAKINDVNVLIGGNDSGKSNVLKALNLFFNNSTELNVPFFFNDDLSRIREKEVKESKGKATIWIRITFNNFLKWKSLPNQFSIKRSWNRYENRPVDSYSNDLPATTVGKFLNKLSFHYIPAVRGRNIFSHYLNELHDALIDDEKAGVRSSANDLLASINKSTLDMSEKIKSGLDIDSSIQVPEDLRQLFSTLDFSTKFSGYDMPLQKRGDGIQARHIPFILDFIARHSNKYHLWAYEEPESSLELSKAFDLAKQFQTDFSKENQIFLTTHSPAFYDLAGQSVTKWHVKSLETGVLDDEYKTSVEVINNNDVIDESLGIAGLIASRAKELYEQIRQLKDSEQKLFKQLALAETNQILVEGPTDKEILEVAFHKLFPSETLFCEFIPTGGAQNLTHNLKAYRTQEKVYPFSIVGLYDNDPTGRKEYETFKEIKLLTNGFRALIDHKLYCGVLVIPDFLKSINEEIKQSETGSFELPLSIEFMLSHEAIQKAVDEKVLKISPYISEMKCQLGSMKQDFSKECEKILPKEYWYLAYKVDDSSKKPFAEWVKKIDAEKFIGFKPLFETLKHLCA